jgi:hypothetical protein
MIILYSPNYAYKITKFINRKSSKKSTSQKSTKRTKNNEKENEERRRVAMMSLITQAQKNTAGARPQYISNYGAQRSRQ